MTALSMTKVCMTPSFLRPDDVARIIAGVLLGSVKCVSVPSSPNSYWKQNMRSIKVGYFYFLSRFFGWGTKTSCARLRGHVNTLQIIGTYCCLHFLSIHPHIQSILFWNVHKIRLFLTFHVSFSARKRKRVLRALDSRIPFAEFIQKNECASPNTTLKHSSSSPDGDARVKSHVFWTLLRFWSNFFKLFPFTWGKNTRAWNKRTHSSVSKPHQFIFQRGFSPVSTLKYLSQTPERRKCHQFEWSFSPQRCIHMRIHWQLL